MACSAWLIPSEKSKFAFPFLVCVAIEQQRFFDYATAHGMKNEEKKKIIYAAMATNKHEVVSNKICCTALDLLFHLAFSIRAPPFFYFLSAIFCAIPSNPSTSTG